MMPNCKKVTKTSHKIVLKLSHWRTFSEFPDVPTQSTPLITGSIRVQWLSRVDFRHKKSLIHPFKRAVKDSATESIRSLVYQVNNSIVPGGRFGLRQLHPLSMVRNWCWCAPWCGYTLAPVRLLAMVTTRAQHQFR